MAKVAVEQVEGCLAGSLFAGESALECDAIVDTEGTTTATAE